MGFLQFEDLMLATDDELNTLAEFLKKFQKKEFLAIKNKTLRFSTSERKEIEQQHLDDDTHASHTSASTMSATIASPQSKEEHDNISS